MTEYISLSFILIINGTKNLNEPRAQSIYIYFIESAILKEKNGINVFLFLRGDSCVSSKRFYFDRWETLICKVLDNKEMKGKQMITSIKLWYTVENGFN